MNFLKSKKKNWNGEIELIYSITKITIFVCVLIFAIIMFFSSFYTVETGEVGVEKYFAKVTNITNEGLQFKVPIISSVDKMSIRNCKIQSDIEVSSSDMQTIKIVSQLVYSIPTEKVRNVYQHYKTDIESILIIPVLQEKIQSSVAKYPVEQFVEKRQIISTEIASAVRQQIQQTGIVIHEFLLVNHDFSDTYDKAIESKKIAEQNALRASYELEQKRLEAEAQKLKQASLTPMVLQEMAISKWDGKLPQYWGGNGQLPFIMQNR